MKKNIGIVLLNYKNYEDTIECIESILLQTYCYYSIIVVDNCSKNGSVEQIKKYASEKKQIYILENDENLGFAKGNNVGIKYAKDKLKCDFVFVLNSDTILNDRDTLKKLLDKYKESNDVAIINPMCCNKEGEVQIPYLICKSSIIKYSVNIGLYLMGVWIKMIFNLKSTFRKSRGNEDIINDLENNKYVIQGCAYILTPEFFKYYNQLYPNTFLYCEEMALCIYIDKVKLKTIVDTSVIIMHKEGGSSMEILKDKKKRRVKYQIESYFKVIKLLFYSYKKVRKAFSE